MYNILDDPKYLTDVKVNEKRKKIQDFQWLFLHNEPKYSLMNYYFKKDRLFYVIYKD